MASKLEEFITFVETGRYQDAEKYREAAQEEYFKAKNRLGRHERKECESIDQVFSFIEKGLYREAKGMLSKAKYVFQRIISPVLCTLHVSKGTITDESRHKKPCIICTYLGFWLCDHQTVLIRLRRC